MFAVLNESGELWKSLDRGVNWRECQTGMPSVSSHGFRTVAIDPVDTNIVYAAGSKVYVSFDAGKTWQSMEDGLPGTFGTVHKIRVDPRDHSRVYAASEGCGVLVYHRTRSLAPREQAGTIPDAYYLAPNFPNPFNSSTAIRFGLPQRCRVLIEVYNVAGQRVCTLVDEEQSAGHHTVVWNGQEQQGPPLPSGIYFYRMRAGDFVQTRKMTLIY